MARRLCYWLLKNFGTKIGSMNGPEVSDVNLLLAERDFSVVN